MKTKLFSFQALVAVMLSVVMSMSFASCSDDDDEPADLASVILGTWEWSETNDNGVFEVEDVIRVNSFKDGTFAGVYVSDDYSFKAVDAGGYFNWFEPAGSNSPALKLRAVAVSNNRIEWREYLVSDQHPGTIVSVEFDGRDEFGDYITWIWVRK